MIEENRYTHGSVSVFGFIGNCAEMGYNRSYLPRSSSSVAKDLAAVKKRRNISSVTYGDSFPYQEGKPCLFAEKAD